MKITKKQLKKLISEESKNHTKMTKFNESVREAYAEHLLLTHPRALLSEGLITTVTYRRAIKMQMLNESGRTNLSVQEGFFDDVKSLAKKVGGKVMKKAKEIGNTEIDTKKAAKNAKRIGKEAGELASGIGSGLWNALAPVAKKLGGGAVDMAKDAMKSAVDNLPAALSAVEKVVGKTVDSAVKGVKGAAGVAGDAIGDAAHSLAGMIEKAKEGLDLEDQAKNSPDVFLATYKVLQDKLNDMGVPAETPDTAAASLGVWESPDGQKALAHGAKQAGITPAELKAMTALYVTQSKYVDMASKAKAKMAESKRTQDIIRSLVKEII